MIPTHFHFQVQFWQLHSNGGNQHEQLDLTKYVPTVKLSQCSKDFKQLQHYLPQCFTHILIIYLHWCFGPQGDILSTNPTLQVSLAISLDMNKVWLRVQVGKQLLVSVYNTFVPI